MIHMNSCINSRLAYWFVASVLVTTGSVYAADQVTRQSDGEIIRGELTALEETSVVIRRSNDEEVRISPDDIRDIRFHREPPALQTARSNERSGEYSAAIEQLREVQAEYEGSDQRVVTELEFLIARCQAHLAFNDPARAPAAIDTLKVFLQRHPNSYRILEAKLLQARLLMASDRPQANSLLDQVRNGGVDGFAAQSGIVLGQTLLSENKAQQGLQIFGDVIKQSQNKPALLVAHFDAQIGRAQCLQQLSRFEEAVKMLETVIDAVPEDQSSTLAKAWNQLGDCERQQDHTKAALLAYLHVDLLYPEVAEAHAQALHYLGSLWHAAGHPARARDAQSRLQTQYPSSRWVQASP